MKLRKNSGRQTAIWFSLVLLTLVVLVLPFLVGSQGKNVTGDVAAVFAAGSNHYTLREPIKISSQPEITVQRGTLTLPKKDNGNDGAAMMSRLAQGTAALVISNAVISVQVGEKPTASETSRAIVAPLGAALSQFRINSLTIEDGEVLLNSGGEARYRLERVETTIEKVTENLISAQGSFFYRDQPLSFETEVDISGAKSAAAEMPIQMKVQGQFGSASFVGSLVRRVRTQIIAEDARLDIANLGQTAHWLGIPWPHAHEIGSFSAKGNLDWSGETIAFQGAEFDVGGNTAKGTLSLNFETSRPLIEGTLAFTTIDLDRYFGLQPSGETKVSAESSSDLANLEYTKNDDGALGGSGMRALRALDADLRISAESVVSGKVNIANSAAALSLKEGKLLAELAELGLGPTGRGDIQISIDVNGEVPAYGIHGHLVDADIGPLFQLVFRGSVLSGLSNVKIDITSRGESYYDFLRAISGEVEVEMKKGAVLALDIPALVDAKKRGSSAPGWGSANKGTTQLEDVDLSISIENGVAKTEKASARAAQQKLVAEGTIELHSKALDLLIRAIEPDQRADRLKNVFGLHAQGNWEKPHIVTRERAETGPKPDKDRRSDSRAIRKFLRQDGVSDRG